MFIIFIFITNLRKNIWQKWQQDSLSNSQGMNRVRITLTHIIRQKSETEYGMQTFYTVPPCAEALQ